MGTAEAAVLYFVGMGADAWAAQISPQETILPGLSHYEIDFHSILQFPHSSSTSTHLFL